MKGRSKPAAWPACRLPRIRTRLHRCYELAWLGQWQAPEWVIVHGSIAPDGVALGHAWLLHEGQVFCPTADRIYSEAEYAAEMKAVILATFNVKQAAAALLAHRHYGPWHGVEELLHRRDGCPVSSGELPWMA